ncbi:MAG: hypothetical protein U0R23_04190 [Candidatus Nanopelagicales bacterium]
MTQATAEPMAGAGDPRRPWQIAVAILSLLTLTLLIINVVLRTRADSAVRAETEAVATAEDLRAQTAQLSARNEELLTQLSTSNERLAEVTGRLSLTEKQVAAADANVTKQVAAQQAAERALRRADGGLRRAQAEVAALQAQLRNAQTCSAAAITALAQIHSGPDIETGSDQAATTLEAVLPACRAGLK